MAEARALHAALPRIAPAEATRRNAALLALNAMTARGGRMRARLAEGDAAPMLRLSGDLAVRPLLAEGQPCAWTPAPAASVLPEALIELSRAEPLLLRIEQAWGVPLEPTGMGAAPAGALHLIVEMADADGRPVHALLLAIGAEAPLPASPPRSAQVPLAGAALHARAGVILTLRGPVAPADELPLLGRGDWVLLPAAGGELAADLAWAGGSLRGCWRATTGRFASHDAQGGGMDGGAQGEGELSLAGDIPVRLSAELATLELPLAELARLAPGAVLSLPPLGDTPAVRLLAGGALVATGRLVALGEGYAVVVDEVAQGSAGAAA